MSFHIKTYDELSREGWQAAAMSIDGSNRLHSYDFIAYKLAFSPEIRNLSFVVFNENKALALSGLGLSFQGKENASFSFAGQACGVPAFADMPQSDLRKLNRFTYDYIDELATKNQVKSGFFASPPVTVADCNHASTNISNANLFYPVRFGYIPEIHNSSVLFLGEEEERLFEAVSKYQRKHIRKSVKAGLSVEAYSGRNNSHECIQSKVEEMREMHLRVSGRKTRSDMTWQAMAKSCTEATSTLFICYLGQVPVSYLFCGEHYKCAYGWSQVNVPEYEVAYSPRHFCEWEAAVFYKRLGFTYYDVGLISYAPTANLLPSPKEISISQFKERYGGKQYPYVFWHKFYDDAQLKDFFKRYYCNLADFDWPECR